MKIMKMKNLSRIVNAFQFHSLSKSHYDCHDVRLSIVRNVKIFIFKFKEGKLIGRHLRVDQRSKKNKLGHYFIIWLRSQVAGEKLVQSSHWKARQLQSSMESNVVSEFQSQFNSTAFNVDFGTTTPRFSTLEKEKVIMN